MKRLITLTAGFALCLTALAQQTPVYCGFDYFIKMKKTHDQVWYQAYQANMENWQRQKAERGGGGTVYTVPVVFHVVYNTDNQNIPDSVVLSQLEVLNEDYRRLNADAINTREEFLPVAADMEIQFQLADFDPDGNATTGITHTFTDRSGFELDLFATENTLDEVKNSATGGVDAWDPEHYMNIWICNVEPSLFGQIFGLSYPPADLDNWPAGSSAPTPEVDGVIVHYTTVGRNNPVADEDDTEFNNMGRTLTHEVGHYLGLRHTWGDELFADPCSEDDGMSDTPLCGSGDQYACDNSANTCDEGDGDLPDQFENYMDYTKDECYNMFTLEQKSMMRYVLENPRIELIGSPALAVNETSQLKSGVYPNPCTDRIQLQLPDRSVLYTISLFNQMGQLISTVQGYPSELNMSQLQTGIYIVKIESSKGLAFHKIQKL